MNKKILKIISIVTVVLFMSIFVLELDAFARAGSGRSSAAEAQGVIPLQAVHIPSHLLQNNRLHLSSLYLPHSRQAEAF